MAENHGNWYYEMKELGFNYRLTDLQASLGISQLSKNIAGVKKRNEIAELYKGKLDSKIKHQHLPSNSFNAHHLFVIQTENRKKLYDYLISKGIFVQIHYIPIHTLPYYKKIGYEGAKLNCAENYYKNCISLPMFPTLKRKEIDYVIKLVNNYVNNRI